MLGFRYGRDLKKRNLVVFGEVRGSESWLYFEGWGGILGGKNSRSKIK